MELEKWEFSIAFNRSAGRCECRGDHAEHRGRGRCNATFSRDEGWLARRLNRDLPDTARNCELLCPECFALVEAAEQAVAGRA